MFLKFGILRRIFHLLGVMNIVLILRWHWWIEAVATLVDTKPRTTQQLSETLVILFVENVIHYGVNHRVQEREFVTKPKYKTI